ncbi:MAG: methylmalonyl Co-A mutase-associated GTPase MeaB [Deltaproteobacteria bacterium]|nr:MAG: methylmalonyl Co-A mutase-associated GTPase MeaB [Deltaproteobacteria bacterium]
MTVADDILNGDLRAAGRLMREMDMLTPESRKALKHLFPHTGHAHIIGVTGSAGAGKSTLIAGLISHFRKQDKSLGILVVDPSSPFTEGAVLGDRIRLQRHAMDKGVFIHSIATRGNTGGLSASVPGIVAVMDAMGKDFILIETVGAGQDEVDVLHLAHTNIVVVTPSMGDHMQTLKAGILETAHIFALNKSDQPEATATHQLLEMITQTKGDAEDAWIPPIVQTQAIQHHGISELANQIHRHVTFSIQTGYQKNVSARLRGLLTLILREQVLNKIKSELGKDDKWQDLMDRIHQKQIDPYSAAEEILNEII